MVYILRRSGCHMAITIGPIYRTYNEFGRLKAFLLLMVSRLNVAATSTTLVLLKLRSIFHRSHNTSAERRGCILPAVASIGSKKCRSIHSMCIHNLELSSVILMLFSNCL